MSASSKESSEERKQELEMEEVLTGFMFAHNSPPKNCIPCYRFLRELEIKLPFKNMLQISALDKSNTKILCCIYVKVDSCQKCYEAKKFYQSSDNEQLSWLPLNSIGR